MSNHLLDYNAPSLRGELPVRTILLAAIILFIPPANELP